MENEIKTHHLKTIQNIYDAIDENNMEFFLVDFRIFLIECVKAKMLNVAALSVIGEEPNESNGLQIEEFEWIEDGKHDNHGTFISLQTESDNEITKLDINDIISKIPQA